MSTEKLNALIEPETCEVKKRRWQLLGHILRMDNHVPTKKATIDALKTKKEKREKPNTGLLTTIKNDLKRHSLSIDMAIELANDRKSWKLKGSRASAKEKLLDQHFQCFLVNPNK